MCKMSELILKWWSTLSSSEKQFFIFTTFIITTLLCLVLAEVHIDSEDGVGIAVATFTLSLANIITSPLLFAIYYVFRKRWILIIATLELLLSISSAFISVALFQQRGDFV